MSVLRRIAVSLLGVALIIVGGILLVLPGPGILTIIAGLAMLGTEFERPRAWVRALRERVSRS